MNRLVQMVFADAIYGGWGWGGGGGGGGVGVGVGGGGWAFVVTLGAIGATKCTGIVLVMDTSPRGDVCLFMCVFVCVLVYVFVTFQKCCFS